MRRGPAVGGVAVGALAAFSAVSSGYLIALLGAAALSAARRARAEAAAPGPPARFVVLVPAHDEESVIERAVASLRSQAEELCGEIIVVADNCGDRTAELAAGAGATVWERHEPERHGKGWAVAWALDRVWRERPGIEAVAMMDADCVASPEFLPAAGARIAAGARAVQVSYGVSNADESAVAAARYAGFALINHVRPLGKSALGLSCGLLGSGMAFDASLLKEVPWRAFGVTEDTEYHLSLVAAGTRVEFAPEASVVSAMPTSEAGADVQRARWEAGTSRLVRRWTRRLIACGARERDLNQIHAGLELLVPPQSLLLATGLVTAAAAMALSARWAAALAVASVTGQAVFVLGGLALARAPASAYRALAMAPLLVAQNARLYSRLARGREPERWTRTPRGK